jgi:ketosteroid isomerase-like protein
MHTPAGVVAATGKAIRWDSCDFLRVRDGRFVSWHVYHDPMPFLGALGLLTAP